MNGTLASPSPVTRTTTAPTSGLHFVGVLLRTPWLAGQRWSRWLMVASFVVLLAFAVPVGRVGRGPHAQLAAMFLYALGLTLVWAVWLSHLVFLARDGEQLRIAGLTRAATFSALLYAALMLALPAGVAALAGWDVAFCVLAAALGIAMGLGFMLLPRWISVWMAFLPAIYSGLHKLVHFPSPLDPRFQYAGWVVLIALVVVILQSWRTLVRQAQLDDGTGWNGSLILYSRSRALSGGGWLDQHWGWEWQRVTRRETPVDFRGIGPAAPARALQVALGGWYVPQLLRGRLRGLSRVGLTLLVLVIVLGLQSVGQDLSWQRLWNAFGLSTGLWVGLFGSAMLGMATVLTLQRLCTRHAGLALLALLPGIGDTAAQRRHLLRAIFVKPAVVCAVLTACMLVPMAALRLGAIGFANALLIEAAFVALTVMAVLRILSGTRTSLAMKITLGVLLIVLVDVSASLAFIAPQTRHGAVGSGIGWALAAAWLLLAAWAAWRAAIAWGRLQRRPHPFLPMASA